ncbi:MAG: glycerol-3-phosphate dehydrogenase C-terminal domain-containing protein, partial [Mycobacterium leprae]
DRRTAVTPLPGAYSADGRPWAVVQADLAAQLISHGVPAAAVERILWLYGARAGQLLAMGAPWLEPLAPGVPAVKGEVRLAIEQEMASTLLDFLDRRSSLLLFSDDQGAAAAAPAAELMAQLLGWSDAHRRQQLASYEAAAVRCRPALGPATVADAAAADGRGQPPRP